MASRNAGVGVFSPTLLMSFLKCYKYRVEFQDLNIENLIVKIGVPSKEFNTNNIRNEASEQIKVPLNEQRTDISFDVLITDEQKAEILNYFDTWVRSNRTKDGLLNYPVEYQRDLSIYIYEQTGNQVFKTFTYTGFLSSLSHPRMGEDRNQVYKLTGTFEVHAERVTG